MVDQEDAAAGPLERYVSILELIAAFPGELSAADAAHALRLPKSTTHRLLRVLSRSGLIEGGDHKERTLSLGSRLTRLVHAAGQADWIEAAVQPTLVQASANFPNGSFYLARLAGHRVFVVASAAGDPRWKSYVVPGYELAPHAAATAKVILSHQGSDIVDQALSAPLQAFTRHTVTDPAAVRAEIKAALKDGYATCIEAIHEGMSALAIPIQMRNDEVIYALGVTGPITRVITEDRDSLISVLRNTADALAPILSLRGSKP